MKNGDVLDLLVAVLPHLRGGLDAESALFTARLLKAELGLDACAVIDRDHVLSFVGSGEDHHRAGGPNLTHLTARVLETGIGYTAHRPDEIGCPVAGCPLTAVTIAPFIVRGAVVGALKIYGAGRPISDDGERVAYGLARVFSVYLELAELDQRAALVTRAELTALRARIGPHFLFNTLTTIAALTRTDPARAHDLIVDFADYFRASLSDQAEFVALDDELEHVERYLSFELARFGDRLRIVFDVDARARMTQVPVLSVQPLVENAIAHGLTPRGRGTVRVSAKPVAGGVEIAVEDDGVGFANGTHAGLGIGMANVEERLVKLFGPRSALQTRSEPGRGTRVSFRVPVRVPEAAR